MYGVNVPRQMRSARLAGFVKTLLTSKRANTNCAPAGSPIGLGRQSWIFAEAKAASGPVVIVSTYMYTVTGDPVTVTVSFQTAPCSPGAHASFGCGAGLSAMT